MPAYLQSKPWPWPDRERDSLSFAFLNPLVCFYGMPNLETLSAKCTLACSSQCSTRVIEFSKRVQGDDAGNDPLVDSLDAFAGLADPNAIGEINRLTKYDHRAAEDAAGEPAPRPSSFWSALAENPFDTLMVHRNDSYWKGSVRDCVGRAVFNHRKVPAAGSLVENEEIVPLQKIDVFAHQPGI